MDSSKKRKIQWELMDWIHTASDKRPGDEVFASLELQYGAEDTAEARRDLRQNLSQLLLVYRAERGNQV